MPNEDKTQPSDDDLAGKQSQRADRIAGLEAAAALFEHDHARRRFPRVINTAFNILFLLADLTTAILIWTEPGQWSRWITFGFFVTFSLSKFRLMCRYFGLYPPESSWIQGSPLLILINLKGCLLFPLIAILLAIVPAQKGFYFAAMTYLIGSAVWAPVFQAIKYRLDAPTFTFTERTRRIWANHASLVAVGDFMFWLFCAAVFSLWHRYSFSAAFWHPFCIATFLYATTTATQLRAIAYCRRALNELSNRDGNTQLCR